MNKLLVKVCGLTEPDNIRAISALEVDMLGFIFYPPSPRAILQKTKARELLQLDIRQQKVGVFVDESVDKIFETAQEYGLTAIQLHGHETPDVCQSVKMKHTVLKAFPVAAAADFEPATAYEGSCDYFLFDTKGPNRGGNGVAFDWEILAAYNGITPFFLSGGISRDDAQKIREINHPKLAGIDLNSRFETSPGIKNVGLINNLIMELI